MVNKKPITATEVNTHNRVVCPDCDWVMDVPAQSQSVVHCPRCKHALGGGPKIAEHTVVALAVTALLLGVVAALLPFAGYFNAGVEQSIRLLDSSRELAHFHEQLLAVLVLFTIYIIPLCYLLIVLALFVRLAVLPNRALGAASIYAVRIIVQLRTWMMADVFLLGALISLIKVSGLASVSLGSGFYIYILFVIALLVTAALVQRYQLWHRLPHDQAPPSQTQRTAAEQQLIGCICCHAPNTEDASHCWRCGESLRVARWQSRSLTLALLVAAAVMLLPAHILPVMTTTSFGVSSPSTIIGGVIQLWQSGDAPVAIIVFVASLVIPIVKILILGMLLVTKARSSTAQRHRILAYRVTDWIGRWSMIDIFVVAILVALVRSGKLMSVYPGNAAVAFALTVILTMLAAMTMDTKRFFKDSK